MGKKVLVLDLDPQGNTTSGYGIDKNTSWKYNIWSYNRWSRYRWYYY